MVSVGVMILRKRDPNRARPFRTPLIWLVAPLSIFGCCLLFLAAMYQIIDIKQWRRWSFAFVVLGMNSLAFYVMRHTLDVWFSETLRKHFGTRVFQVFGAELQPVMLGACTFLIFWLVTLWMYRRKIFIRL